MLAALVRAPATGGCRRRLVGSVRVVIRERSKRVAVTCGDVANQPAHLSPSRRKQPAAPCVGTRVSLRDAAGVRAGVVTLARTRVSGARIPCGLGPDDRVKGSPLADAVPAVKRKLSCVRSRRTVAVVRSVMVRRRQGDDERDDEG